MEMEHSGVRAGVQFFIYASFTFCLTFLPFRFAVTTGKVSCIGFTKRCSWSSSLLCMIKLSSLYKKGFYEGDYELRS